MIQSSDCCFYENELMDNAYRYPDNPASGYACSNTGEIRREKKEMPSKNLKEKKKQSHLTIKWLKQNYCASPDVCLPREIVYEQYLEFCRKEKITPACKATFGKLIRNTFPEVSSKRLGARGHSKYHYNGIGIKLSSKFRSATTDSEGVTRFSAIDKDSERMILKNFSLSSKIGTLLPNFPDVEDLVIPVSSDKAKMSTFLLMYKTHCQCLLDVVVSGNFEEIRLFLLHFWQGFPEHLMSLRTSDVFLDVVVFCDSILYRTLLGVLIPSATCEISERLLRNIHNIGACWHLWIECSLENMPQELLQAKMASARRFCRSLKRCVAFLHLVQVTRPLLTSDAPLRLYEELEESLLEFEKSNLYSSESEDFESLDKLIIKQAKELQHLFKKCSSLYSLINELDQMILSIQNWYEDEAAARNFIFSWVYMLSKMSHVLTENQTKYFTAFHLLSSLFQEYVLLAVETKLDKEQEKRIHDRLNKHIKNKGKLMTKHLTFTRSYCLSDRRKSSSSESIFKGDSNQIREYNEISVSQMSNAYQHTNVEIYSSTWLHNFRTNNESYLQEMPSCKYAPNTFHPPFQYDSHLSATSIRDGHNTNGLTQYVPVHFSSNLSSHQADRDNALITYSLPEFETNQFENACLYTSTNQNLLSL